MKKTAVTTIISEVASRDMMLITLFLLLVNRYLLAMNSTAFKAYNFLRLGKISGFWMGFSVSFLNALSISSI